MPETAIKTSTDTSTHNNSNNANNSHNFTLTVKTAVDTAVVSVLETTTGSSQPPLPPLSQSSWQRNGNSTGGSPPPPPPALNDDTDDSNPQQGAPLQSPPPTTATAAATTTTKVPPTVKDARKIFVGGLPSDVTPEEFLHCFEQFGTVLDSVIMYDRITTRSRGFGFITFESPETCRQLIQMKRIPMRPEKFVEIKEAQPRETTMTANNSHQSSQTYPLPNKYRGGGDVSMMMHNAPFVTGMNPATLGEPSMMDPSYMGMAYGSVPNVPQSPPVGRNIIDFSSYPTHATLSGSPQYYSSNLHFGNNVIFVPDTTTTCEEGPSNIMFAPSSMAAPSNFQMPYGEAYVSNYGIENAYRTSDELSPPMYPISMTYYNNNNQYIPAPPPSDMTNHFDSPHRTTGGHPTMVYPYDPNTTMSPTRTFFMASPSYLPTTELTPTLIGDTKQDYPSSEQQDIVEGVTQLNLNAVEPPTHPDSNEREEKESMTKTFTIAGANGDQKIDTNQDVTE